MVEVSHQPSQGLPSFHPPCPVMSALHWELLLRRCRRAAMGITLAAPRRESLRHESQRHALWPPFQCLPLLRAAWALRDCQVLRRTALRVCLALLRAALRVCMAAWALHDGPLAAWALHNFPAMPLAAPGTVCLVLALRGCLALLRAASAFRVRTALLRAASALRVRTALALPHRW